MNDASKARLRDALLIVANAVQLQMDAENALGDVSKRNSEEIDELLRANGINVTCLEALASKMGPKIKPAIPKNAAAGDTQRDELESGNGSSDIAAATSLAMSGAFEVWRGLLSDLQPLQMRDQGALGDVSPFEVHYSAAQVPLERVIRSEEVRKELDWATDFVRIMCAQSVEGTIRSIHAVVGHSEKETATDLYMVLNFKDRNGTTAIIKLTSDRPSVVLRDTVLFGDFFDLILTISLAHAT